MYALLLAATMAVGADPQPAPKELTPADLNKLVQIRKDAEYIADMLIRGYDVDPGGKVLLQLGEEAKKVSGGRVQNAQDLYALTGGDQAPPTGWEQFKGLFTFVNILWVLGAVLFGTAIIWLFGHYFLELILLIPAEAWEVVLWLGFGGLTYCAHFVDPAWQLAVLMPAAIGFLGATALTCHLHGKGKYNYEIPSLMLAVAWGAMAVAFGSHVLGFMTVMALLSALGFICGHFPGCVWIGFYSDSVVSRSTVAAGAMLVLHVLFTVTGTLAQPLAVFREGMNFMGSFVYFLGVLIMSNKYWCYNTVQGDEQRWRTYGTDWQLYGVMQVLVLVSGIAALYFGSVFGMSALLGFGGTFFMLYILEKYYELPWSGVGWAWSLLGLGGILYGMGVFIKAHPQYFLFGG